MNGKMRKKIVNKKNDMFFNAKPSQNIFNLDKLKIMKMIAEPSMILP